MKSKIKIPVDARRWHGGAAAPDASRAVTNCRRSKVIRFPRETRIAVSGLRGRFLGFDTRARNQSFYYSVWVKND
jgi:hypothetical protein